MLMMEMQACRGRPVAPVNEGHLLSGRPKQASRQKTLLMVFLRGMGAVRTYGRIAQDLCDSRRSGFDIFVG